MKKKSCNEWVSNLYKWYFELETGMKKLTIHYLDLGLFTNEAKEKYGVVPI